MKEHHIKVSGNFILEAGGCLNDIEITYHTSGELTPKSKVIWICHALTANSNPEDWWPGMVGDGKFYNPKEYFIVCANILGSCYGTTGPLSANAETNRIYYRDFPLISIRDMVAAHNILREKLGINSIHTLIGSSVGGFQALEMALLIPDKVEHLVLLATNSRITPWATALNEAQRMAIFADSTYYTDIPTGGLQGMAAARAMALLSYRSYEGYNLTQSEENENTLLASKAASYQQYQGKKLANRFNAYSYVILSLALDSHNVGRGRGSVEKALNKVKSKTLLIGINSDNLFPPSEQLFIHHHIPNSEYKEIQSAFGHDGFLLESDQIAEIIQQFYESK